MTRLPDGLLTHELFAERGPQDACGVFGVWAPGEEVAKLTFYGLYALQHRGTESAGIAATAGDRIVVFKEMGLVSQVFTEADLETLTGHIAIGHTRYSTTGSSKWENAQPTLRATDHGSLALAHNGNLTNTGDLLEVAQRNNITISSEITTDTEIMTALLAEIPSHSIEASAMEVLPILQGAFSLVFMDEHTLYAARDRNGVRPLVLGRLDRGYVVASESAALDIVGATFVREIEPGELIAIDENGLRSRTFATPDPKGCLFEYVYLARPDTIIAGRNTHATRVAVGERLAHEHPAIADLVIPVPESGTPAAVGYAKASGIPYGAGLVKNSYVGRTFIQPSQTIRQLGIRLKLNPLKDIVAGKRLVVVDDDVLCAPGVVEPCMLRSHARIIQAGGNRMRFNDLAVGILQEIGPVAMQHARFAGGDRGRMPAAGDAVTARLHANQLYRLVGNVGVEDPDRIGAAADAGNHRVGLAPRHLRHLLATLAPDHRLKIPHHHGIRVRAGNRTDDVKGVVDVGDPIAHGFVERVLERL